MTCSQPAPILKHGNLGIICFVAASHSCSLRLNANPPVPIKPSHQAWQHPPLTIRMRGSQDGCGPTSRIAYHPHQRMRVDVSLATTSKLARPCYRAVASVLPQEASGTHAITVPRALVMLANHLIHGCIQMLLANLVPTDMGYPHHTPIPPITRQLLELPLRSRIALQLSKNISDDLLQV